MTNQPIVIDIPVGEYPVIRDVHIEGSGDVALVVRCDPRPWSVVEHVVIERPIIRGDWNVGIRIENGQNVRIVDPFIEGLHTMETIQHPKMSIGIDLTNAMDSYVIRPAIACAEIGVRIADPDRQGHGEGWHVVDGWLMHVNDGVRAEGSLNSNWPTPVGHVTGTHIAFLQHGVFATAYSGLHISDNDFYPTHVSPFAWGVFLAGGCAESIVTSNRFWHNKGGGMDGAVVLDASRRILIANNVITPTYALGIVATPSCSRILVANNLQESPNYGVLVEKRGEEKDGE